MKIYNKNKAIERMNSRFQEILLLDYDWDSYEAPPIDRVAATRAKNFANILIDKGCLVPFVTPMSNGGVALEWYDPEYEFTIEFNPKDYDGIYFRDEYYEWEGDFEEYEAENCFKTGVKAISDPHQWDKFPTFTSVYELIEDGDEISSL